MGDIFKTFKPQHPQIRKYVDYYYLDIKPDNQVHTFECFPHFNNTISLYRSHVRVSSTSAEICYAPSAGPIQIFMPIREQILNVRQCGMVHRMVIVFHPLGIQQFFRHVDFTVSTSDYTFFSPEELQALFSTTDTSILADMMDGFLQSRFEPFTISALEDAVSYIYANHDSFTVARLAQRIGMSRQHINRLFKTHLGVSVKKFHEIFVFRQTINKKLFETPDRNFTQLAYELNYSDQSHLNKIYKTLTRNSPRKFFDRGTVLGDEDTFWHLLES